MNKFHQGGKRTTLKTIRHWWKKLKKTQIYGNIFHAHKFEELCWWNVPVHTTQAIYTLSKISIKIPIAKIIMIKHVTLKNSNGNFYRNKTNNTKMSMNHKRFQIAKATLKRRTKLEVSLSNFKMYYKATVI